MTGSPHPPPLSPAGRGEYGSVPCPVCGCACDDLTVTVADGRIASAANACELARPWFGRQNTSFPPPTEVDGVAVEPGVAYGRAAEILRRAKNTLIYGFHRSSPNAVRAAAALADRLGATIDVADPGLAPSTVALQKVGESTCTLGEVKQRADLVVFWGCDPTRTHPRLIERYCPPRPGRRFVVVDEAVTEMAKSADLFVRLTPGREWEVIWTLRLMVKKSLRMVPLTPNPSPPRGEGDGIHELADRMKSCQFGVIFFGDGLTRGPNAHRTVEALYQLVTDLNRFTRFYALSLRPYSHGADAILTSQFGYPFGVNLAAGYPRYSPGEFTGPEMLARNEVDACLLVGGGAEGNLSAEAITNLRRIPMIALDGPESAPMTPATVRFVTAVAGVHTPGSVHRLDGVVLPVHPLLPTRYPEDAEVLAQMLKRIEVTASPGRAVNPTGLTPGAV